MDPVTVPESARQPRARQGGAPPQRFPRHGEVSATKSTDQFASSPPSRTRPDSGGATPLDKHPILVTGWCSK